MKNVQKAVIALVLIMCLLFSEIATLISYAVKTENNDFVASKNGFIQNTEDFIDIKAPVTEIDLTISENTIYTLEENKIDFTLVLKNTSQENELFENPIIEIELPEEIEEVKIDKVMMLYKNGLSISKWKVKEENLKKYLYIELEGIQTKYQNSTLIDGTNVIIETTLKPYKTTPIKESTFKLRYQNSDKNIDYLQEEKSCKEYDIQFMSRYGLLTLNGIENLSKENEKNLAIGETIKSIDLDIESEEQILNHEMAIINNYTKSLENVEIIGNISTENNEKFLQEELENTFTSTLLTTIGTQGVENQVYYSDEINPSKDSQAWTQNYEELQKISSYKIVIDQLNSGEILEFNYQSKTPENLTYNQTIYSTYEVNYIYDNQEQVAESIVIAKTEEKEVVYEDCQIQEVADTLDIGIYASKGGKQLTEDQNVHEGNIIKYSIVITNNSSQDVENINVDTEITNGNFYELKVLEPGEYMGDPNIEFTDYFENTSKENKNYTIERIESGENVIIDIDSVIRNKNENDNNTINLNCTLKIDSEEYEFSSISNSIINSKMNLYLGYGGTENVEIISESDFKLDLEILNLSIEDISQVKFKLDIPSIFEIDKLETEKWNEGLIISNITKKEDRKICTFKITDLSQGQMNEIIFMGMLGKIDLDLNSINTWFVCSANYEDEIYVSNNYIKTINQNKTNLDVKLISNIPENEFVFNEDEIIYDLIIENTGNIDTEANIIIPIPDGIEYDMMEIYINDEFIEEKKLEDYYIRLSYLIKSKEKFNLKFKVKVNEDLFKFNQEEIKLYAEISSNNIDSKIITEEIIFYIENEDKQNEIIDKEQELLPDIIEDENSEKTENSETIDIESMDKFKEEINNTKPDDSTDNEFEDDFESDSNPDNSNKEDEENNNIEDSENNNDNINIPTDQEKPESNNNSESKPEVYGSISGMVWSDINNNGLKDSSERNISGIKVKLFDNSQKIKKDGWISEVTTNDNGEYQFKNLLQGEYIVVFEYNSELHDVTLYSVNSASSPNSKGLYKNINGKSVAITNILTINGNDLQDINLGLSEKEDFDLKIDKTISSIKIKNGKDDRTTYYNKEKIIKEEITSKYLEGTEVTITYNIKISNIGTMSGYINKIEDYIPAGLKFNESLNNNWYENNKILVNTSLTDLELQPGESIEIPLILTKTMTEDSLGTFTNKAGIIISSNSKKIEDSDISNNQSEVSLIISIKTGKIVMYSLCGFILLVILGGILHIKLKFFK